MALDATKWAFTAARGVRYIGAGGNLHGQAGANYVSVYELHRWLQDLADDAAAAGDDLMDITKLNPSDKKFTTIIELLNGAFLDDAHTSKASEYIYGGSIIQNPGGGEDIYDGINVVANRGVIVNVIQNNTVLTPKFWNTVPSGETFAGLNPDPTNGIAMRFLVKVKSAGAMIDNGALILTTREWGKTFSEFRKPATGSAPDGARAKARTRPTARRSSMSASSRTSETPGRAFIRAAHSSASGCTSCTPACTTGIFLDPPYTKGAMNYAAGGLNAWSDRASLMYNT